MVETICFLFPAFLAVRLCETKQDKLFDGKTFIRVYFLFVCVINMLSLGAMALIFCHPQYMLNSAIFNVGFIYKYLLLSFVLAAILPSLSEKLYTHGIMRLTKKST